MLFSRALRSLIISESAFPSGIQWIDSVWDVTGYVGDRRNSPGFGPGPTTNRYEFEPGKSAQIDQPSLYDGVTEENSWAVVSKIVFPFLLLLWASSVFPADIEPGSDPASSALTSVTVTDSSQLEQDLQHLSWKQFKSVIESVPKLKADVDAYGPLGWQYVQNNYAKYGWKKNIDRLDDMQKQQLAELIQTAKSAP